jgi:hypothetical protein
MLNAADLFVLNKQRSIAWNLITYSLAWPVADLRQHVDRRNIVRPAAFDYCVLPGPGRLARAECGRSLFLLASMPLSPPLPDKLPSQFSDSAAIF